MSTQSDDDKFKALLEMAPTLRSWSANEEHDPDNSYSHPGTQLPKDEFMARLEEEMIMVNQDNIRLREYINRLRKSLNDIMSFSGGGRKSRRKRRRRKTKKRKTNRKKRKTKRKR